MSEIKALEKKVDLILSYLHNDRGTGAPGLVADFASLKKDFNDFKMKYERDQAIRNAKIGVIGAIAGGVVSFGAYLIKIFL